MLKFWEKQPEECLVRHSSLAHGHHALDAMPFSLLLLHDLLLSSTLLGCSLTLGLSKQNRVTLVTLVTPHNPLALVILYQACNTAPDCAGMTSSLLTSLLHWRTTLVTPCNPVADCAGMTSSLMTSVLHWRATWVPTSMRSWSRSLTPQVTSPTLPPPTPCRCLIHFHLTPYNLGVWSQL